MTKLKVLDLFSGIGGFSLGLERTGGFETVAFCEIEPFCRRVLAKHWPNVRQYEDVRTLTADTLRRDGIAVDVICGGFPCQDISTAGKGAGIAEGTRSGLWAEIARLASEIRPQFVIVENVSALLGNGLDRVLGDLAEIGFDADWHCIPASAIGAPHRRDRIWIVAHSMRERPGQDGVQCEKPQGTRTPDRLIDVGASLADAHESGLQGRCGSTLSRWSAAEGHVGPGDWWATEPDVGRVAHGVPQRVDRLKALGNAVVPQIPELIGRAILEARAA